MSAEGNSKVTWEEKAAAADKAIDSLKQKISQEDASEWNEFTNSLTESDDLPRGLLWIKLFLCNLASTLGVSLEALLDAMQTSALSALRDSPETDPTVLAGMHRTALAEAIISSMGPPQATQKPPPAAAASLKR